MIMQLDKEDIKSYQQRTFFDAPPKNEVNPISIFLAVLAAILVAWFIRAAYIEWQVRQALEIFNQQMQIINAQSQQQMRNIQLRNEAMREKTEERIRLQAEELRQQKLAAQQIDFEKRAAIENKINERSKKEEAWAESYKPARGCEKDNPDRDALICGNDYAKARRHFEATWSTDIQ